MNSPSFEIESIAGTPSDISHLIGPPEIETIVIPPTIEAPISVQITPGIINALISAGFLESIPTKQLDGSICDELLIIDPEWPNIVG